MCPVISPEIRPYTIGLDLHAAILLQPPGILIAVLPVNIQNVNYLNNLIVTLCQ